MKKWKVSQVDKRSWCQASPHDEMSELEPIMEIHLSSILLPKPIQIQPFSPQLVIVGQFQKKIIVLKWHLKKGTPPAKTRINEAELFFSLFGSRNCRSWTASRNRDCSFKSWYFHDLKNGEYPGSSSVVSWYRNPYKNHVDCLPAQMSSKKSPLVGEYVYNSFV